MPRPASTDHSVFHGNYVSLVPGDDPVAIMRSGLETTLSMLRGLPDTVALTKHAPYTWSVKEVLGHIIDSERIFAYRALRIARGDATPLAGFEENDYVLNGDFDARPLESLLAEYESVRRASLTLFEGLPASAWDRRGVANDNPITVRALAFILAGHERHHAVILANRLGWV